MLASVLSAALGLASPDAGVLSPQPLELFLSVAPPSAQCPTRRGLEVSVARRLGFDPFQNGVPRSLHVVLRQEQGSWRADLEFREGSQFLGHQTLSSPSANCADLEPILVLTISVVCGTSPTLAPRADGDVEKQFSVVPEAFPQPTDKLVSPEVSRGPVFWAGAGAVATAGAAPEVALGGTVEIEAAWPRFSIGLQARADFPVTQTLETGQLQTNLFYGALLPCGRLRHWSGCALIALGDELASGSGYPGASTASSFYMGLGLEARLDVPLSESWEIRVHVDLIAPLTRAIVQVQQEMVWRVPAVSAGLGVEVLVALP